MRSLILTIFLLISLINLIFASESIELKTETGIIYGTLELPSNEEVKPLAIIVAGSGPTDRNGNNSLGISANSYKLLAEELKKNNVASLRYDKRGIAESQKAGLNEKKLSFNVYVNDLILWIKKIKEDKRFNKIYVIGHSEGSLIGIIALQNEYCDGLVSISGVGRKASDILIEQIINNKNNPREIIEESMKIINELTNGITVNNISKDLLPLFRPSVQPYLISWFKYNPSEEIKKLDIPILILQGTEDIQVSVKEAEILTNSNKKAELKIIKGMTHTLKDIRDPSEQIKTYYDPNIPISLELVKSILDFIKR